MKQVITKIMDHLLGTIKLFQKHMLKIVKGNTFVTLKVEMLFIVWMVIVNAHTIKSKLSHLFSTISLSISTELYQPSFLIVYLKDSPYHFP